MSSEAAAPGAESPGISGHLGAAAGVLPELRRPGEPARKPRPAKGSSGAGPVVPESPQHPLRTPPDPGRVPPWGLPWARRRWRRKNDVRERPDRRSIRIAARRHAAGDAARAGHHHAPAARGRRALRAPDEALEPEDEALHLRR